ncbi:MAG: aminotransferase class V-fold PLP-dependent enzyme [Planctomycetaceae bacterium]|jgi:cysteine desulfurase family protein|nr:aminotransferase class V-fold PLP-dependent enzyme [Planctomycetaceae bacterium]
MNKIYLDNAATSFPKPESVYLSVENFMRGCGGSAGRSGHYASICAKRVVDDARLLCARLLNAPSPENIIFTNNATTALNFAIHGSVRSKCHVIASSFEHNSVSRPLFYLSKAGVDVTKITTNINTGIDVQELRSAVRGDTVLVICNHLSNVFGTESDIGAVGEICRGKSIRFLVDASQSVGVRQIDVQRLGIDLLAFSGHKGLFGLQGTGGLYVAPHLQLHPIIQGSTGSDININLTQQLEQPNKLPEMLESGTLNTHGLAGLAAGVRFVLDTGVGKIAEKEAELIECLLDGLRTIPRVRIFCSNEKSNRGNVVSLQHETIPPDQIAMILDAGFGIAVRSGLHCAVDAHKTINTAENGGTIRISPNYFNNNSEIESCINALRSICK